MKTTEAQYNQAYRYLVSVAELQKGELINAFCVRTTKSGNRYYKMFIVRKSHIWDITGSIAVVCGYKLIRKDFELVTNGYGSDVVRRLGEVLYPKGFRVGVKKAQMLGVKPGKIDGYRAFDCYNLG